MNREQMIDLAAKVFAELEPGTEWTPIDEREYYTRRAREVLDVILPQVTTMEELAALPDGTKLVGPYGAIVARYDDDPTHLWEYWLRFDGPLTIVWQPS
jgi:hypothetical protein